MPRTTLPVALLLLLLGAAVSTAQETSCVACHGDPDLFGEDGTELLAAFGHDVHGEVGLSCHDCHGGDPDPARSDDIDAMDPGYEPNPYLGAPAPTEVPEFCGRCHSDPSFMRRYRPDARVNQEREYWTSQHGQALRAGDTAVATCVSCHGVHGIRRTSDPEAPVYPTELAETCRGCHSDPELMAGRTTPDGRPLPIDQYGRWRESVHAAALLDRADLSAPTCNDCHGNHGAAPPGLDSIAFVCGQCHGREADLFRSSAKAEGFEEHASFVEGLGAGACAACHEPPEPQAGYDRPHAFTECSSCHLNHAVVRPTVAMLAPLPLTPCDFCHGEVGEAAAGEEDEAEEVRRRHRAAEETLLAQAETLGLEDELRFDWLVEQARELPAHRLAGEAGPGTGEPRPEFAELFAKFRIGGVHFTYTGPDGEEVTERVVRCDDCHAAEPLLAAEPVGLETARAFVERSRELTALTARAERMLLAARRGGVETRAAQEELERAVDAQIELEVLVHTFSAEPDGAFLAKHGEGVEHARGALVRAREALEELSFRRLGLAVSLVFVVGLLVALALKIRQLPPPEGGGTSVSDRFSSVNVNEPVNDPDPRVPRTRPPRVS